MRPHSCPARPWVEVPIQRVHQLQSQYLPRFTDIIRRRIAANLLLQGMVRIVKAAVKPGILLMWDDVRGRPAVRVISCQLILPPDHTHRSLAADERDVAAVSTDTILLPRRQ